MTDHQAQILVSVIGGVATVSAATIGLLKWSARKKESQTPTATTPSTGENIPIPSAPAAGVVAAPAVDAMRPAVPAAPLVPGRLPSVPNLSAGVLKARFVEVREYPCSPPRPESIIADVDSAPPLQRKERAKNYYGIEVRWSGLLTTLSRHHRNPDMLLVILSSSMKAYHEAGPRICFDVPDGPGWALLHHGTFLSIVGEIESVSGGSINLCDVVVVEAG